MNSILDAFLRSWPFEPWLVLALVVSGLVYVRGWFDLRERDPGRWSVRRPVCFLAGQVAIFVALASPIEPFASLFFQAHMVQHLLLMMVAPPLLWLGSPLFPILRGLPDPIRSFWVAPLFRSRRLRWLLAALTHPVVALPVFVVMTWLWHAPRIYEEALRSSALHTVQHICFLLSGLLFWYPVVRPYPARPRWSLWLLFPYLIVADISNTVLSALLTFSGRVLYPYYSQIPRIGGVTALQDQSGAGVLMWVPGSIAYLVPLFVIGFQAFLGTRRYSRPVAMPTSRRLPDSLPILNQPGGRLLAALPSRFDLLGVPILGGFLKWKHARLAMQLPLAAAAVIVILDGLRGPGVAAMNLAGVLPWIHWRALMIVGLLTTGNFFCMACPFMLPRAVARRWLPARWRWPRRFRSKWLALGLLAVFLWAYEALALWNSPWLTAWITIAYFVLAFVVDGFFRGASFCKYLCPIGQFNFVQSMMSPLEVRVSDRATCASCTTRDCVRGNDVADGCAMDLYLPEKVGNMNCTFCLDCVHACPHENIGIIAVAPGSGLWASDQRSRIGRLYYRTDVAALVLLLVFAAFANAGGMVAPVIDWQSAVSRAVGLRSNQIIFVISYVIALVVVPCILAIGASVVSRYWADLHGNWESILVRFCYSLVPLGFAMWLSHYVFHGVTSYATALPAAQRFLADWGWPILGLPEWSLSCCGPVFGWLPRLEILFLDVGLLVSLHSGYRIARGLTNSQDRAVRAFVPWAAVSLVLFMVGIWIVQQPMDMRGTMSSWN